MAEGAAVRKRMEVPDGRIAGGVPARVIEKPVSDGFKEEWTRFKRVYVDLARRNPESLSPLLHYLKSKSHSSPPPRSRNWTANFSFPLASTRTSLRSRFMVRGCRRAGAVH